MKRTFFCLLVSFIAATSCAPAAQAGDTEITASGTGSVSMPPNMATVSAVVETYAEKANDAVSSNNQIYDRVVAAVERLGVARSDITLAYYNVSYNPRPAVTPPTTTGERYGYTVSRGFSVKARDIGKAGSISDACVGAGATGINGVSFGLSDQRAARATAMTRAMAEARSNAESLARAASLHIVSIKSVELNNGGFVGPPQPMIARVSAPTEFDQSNVNVTVSVTAVFIAQP